MHAAGMCISRPVRRAARLGVTLFGLSADSPEWQREAVRRLRLPFDLLSDSELELTRAIGLPTFPVEDRTFIKRVTLVIQDGSIGKVFYPVFPPDRNATDVIDFLRD
jgi:peroxiredoxin